MPAPSQPPIDRHPQPFDRGILRRSVIAIPLLEAIEKEREETEAMRKKYAKRLYGVDTAVFLRKLSDLSKPLSEDRMERLLRRRLDLAIEEVKSPKGERRQAQEIRKEMMPDGQLVFLGHLDGLVVHRLLAIDVNGEWRRFGPSGTEVPFDESPASESRRHEGREFEQPIIDRIWPTRFEVIIDINLSFKTPHPDTQPPKLAAELPRDGSEPDVRKVAQAWIASYTERAKVAAHTKDPDQTVDEVKTRLSSQYVFARLEGAVIEQLIKIDQAAAAAWAEAEAVVVEQRLEREFKTREEVEKHRGPREDLVRRLEAQFRTIHHVWPDFKLRGCITRSIATVKADAAHRAFTALGDDITWAVADSGIDVRHPHFEMHKNVDATSPYHKDFTGLGLNPLEDEYGHGTHVAGIIAGEQSVLKAPDDDRERVKKNLLAAWRELDQDVARTGRSATAELRRVQLDAITGMAPKCKLVSLKVLDRFGQGSASNVITAIAHIQQINHYGRELHIHGVNLSLGYPFDPKWFACGHSPLCVEVNRLVKSGVVVVVAAGNTGYGTLMTKEGQSDAALDLTINDPGNAELAITVGATHRDEPHRYGVSYFSSKGPTGDGRYKPDLLAPGEKIVSCAAPRSRLVFQETGEMVADVGAAAGAPATTAPSALLTDDEEGVLTVPASTPAGSAAGAERPRSSYFETSGTSMAAPHVSGAIAAFLSIRREFVGEPEKVKKIFCDTATDLGRDRYFQGAGLLDLMRAIQSV